MNGQSMIVAALDASWTTVDARRPLAGAGVRADRPADARAARPPTRDERECERTRHRSSSPALPGRLASTPWPD